MDIKTDGFGNPKFRIKKTEFSITKLSPMAGFHMSEFIRISLAKSADSFDSGNGSEEQSAVLFFKSVLGLDPAVVESIRKDLFEHIQFKTEDVKKGWVPVLKSEDMAFENFEVVNIYEVLVRALHVNFSGSFSEITSSFPGVALIIKGLSQKT